jgi:hypothetical protein
MDILRFCFQCPGRCSEFVSEDLKTDEVAVKGLVSQALESLPFQTDVDKVKVDYLFPANMYDLEIRVWWYASTHELSSDPPDVELRIEGLLCYSLLQLCGTVEVFDCSIPPGGS